MCAPYDPLEGLDQAFSEALCFKAGHVGHVHNHNHMQNAVLDLVM